MTPARAHPPAPPTAPHRTPAQRAAFFFLFLPLLAGGCNFPPVHPLYEPTRQARLVNDWPGGPTRTPFQPAASVPAAAAGLSVSTPQPATNTATAAPTGTPELEAPAVRTPVPELGTWPPPDTSGFAPTPVTPVPPPSPLLSGPETVNFLLVGSDRRASSFRTDTLIIASVRPDDRLVTLISIPRDLFVYIPGWTMQRINTAYQQGELSGYPGGGPGLLKDTLRYNLGVRIDHVAMVEFEGFIEIVDTLGGIDVPLACPYTDWHIKNPDRSIDDPNNWKLFTVGPGVVHMDGELALWYARSRLRSTDFDRGRRQQEVLRAMYARGLQLDILPRIPELYAELQEAVETDFSLESLLDLAPLAADLGGARVRSFYINKTVVTSWRTTQGAAVLLPREEALRDLMAEALASPDETDPTSLEAVVEIWNGTEHPDWEFLAAERLHYAGFETRIAPADRRDYSSTRLYDFTTLQRTRPVEILLGSLGLQTSSLVASPVADSPVDYRLVLGEDYNPCFNPAELSH